MAATPQSQHRCVFVGNIPYDATEEKLKEICEEVGPVVSFRLVTDKETGKPKGYGFCEYKDEETALSARRNLQGYEINGRQLRVDFAENDKNADRNRDHGRGGPGIVSSVDPQKHFGGPAVLQDISLHQPIGDPDALAAASIMARALGSAQTASTSDPVWLQSQNLLHTDPLTRHLAKMSRSQLTEIVSQLKAMVIRDKEQARKLLLTVPNLPKALFQAQIMLGVVSPQMLQMSTVRRASDHPVHTLVQSGQHPLGLPPLPQNKTHSGLFPYADESKVSSSLSNPHPAVPQFFTPSQIQHQQLAQNQVLQQGQLPVQPRVSSLHSLGPQSLVGRPTIHVPISSLLNQQVQPPVSQHAASVLLENMVPKGNDFSLTGKTRVANDSIDQMNRASKMVKLNDGRATTSFQANLAIPSQTSDLSERQTSVAKETSISERRVPQIQLPGDIDAALLEQVLNLTPEQLNSLPPDQQQQVIQLQQMLRQAA